MEQIEFFFFFNHLKIMHAKQVTSNIFLDRSAIIDGKIFFDQPVQNDQRAYHNIQKIMTGQGDDYTTVYLLDYSYFTKHYKIIAIDLSKQQGC